LLWENVNYQNVALAFFYPFIQFQFFSTFAEDNHLFRMIVQRKATISYCYRFTATTT
jgi:hypothetical protein